VSGYAADKKLYYWKGQRLEPGSYLTWGASRRQSVVMGAHNGHFSALLFSLQGWKAARFSFIEQGVSRRTHFKIGGAYAHSDFNAYHDRWQPLCDP
jgi:hypothetical protein